MIDLTPFILGAIVVLSGIVTYLVWPKVKGLTTPEQYAFLLTTTKVLVYAAEQLKLTGKITNKLEYVKEGLEKAGFTIDINAIEAMVKELNIAQGKETVKI